MEKKRFFNKTIAVIAVTVFLIWVITISVFLGIRNESYQELLVTESQHVAHSLEDNLHVVINKSNGIELFVLASLDRDFSVELDRYVQSLVDMNQGVENVSYAPLGVISYIYQDSPTTAIGRNLYLDVLEEVREDVVNAQNSRLITVTGSLNEGQHSCSGISFRNPVYDGDTFIGFINLCVSRDYLLEIFSSTTSEVFDFAIYNQYNVPVIGTLPYDENKLYYYEQLCSNVLDWQIGMLPKREYVNSYNTVNSIFMIITFILYGMIGSAIIFYYRRSNIYHSENDRLIYYDYLTGMPNRNKLNKDVEILMHHQVPFFLAYGDIINFKLLNDTFGHQVGDQFLTEIALRMEQLCSKQVQCYRWGGDEFICLLQLNDKEVNRFLESFDELLKTPITISSISHQISICLGVTHFPSQAMNLKDLILFSDIAMHFAREQKNKFFCLYDYEAGKMYKLHRKTEEVVLNLTPDQIEVFLQPIVSLSTDKIIGFESLLRVKYEDAYLNTQSVVNIAEMTGKILMIDLEVFSKSCDFLKSLLEVNPEYILEINLSVISLNHESLQEIQKIVMEKEIDCRNIVREVTETSKIQDYIEIVSILNIFKTMGFFIALDDFGSGYSSLTYLAEIPLTHLKIDRQLILNYQNEKNILLFHSIKALSERLHLVTIAEGIETFEQLSFFKSIHFDGFQGYYYSRPLPFSQLMDLITN